MSKPIEEIRESITDARRKTMHAIGQILNKPTTPGQRLLQLHHGTPMEFAAACVDCIGEISCQEAIEAVEKYIQDWNAA